MEPDENNFADLAKHESYEPQHNLDDVEIDPLAKN